MKNDPNVNEPIEDIVEDSMPDIQSEAEESQNTCPSCEDYKTGWQRALADYDNLQKNMTRERMGMREGVRESFVQSLLPVVDNFDQAVKFAPADIPENLKAWMQGVMYVQQQFTDAFKELGAESYGEVGDMFDPHLHSAAGEKTEEEKTPGEILEVLQRGWKVGNRAVRPANVIIQSN